MSGGLRFAGQEGGLTCVNSTTKEEQIPSINVESISTTIDLEKVKKQFIGRTGPAYRTFADGASFEFKIEHTDAEETAAYLNAMKAKHEGKSNDEFALQWRVESVDGGTLQITLFDLAFDPFDLTLGGRTSVLESTIKGSCPSYLIEAL